MDSGGCGRIPCHLLDKFVPLALKTVQCACAAQLWTHTVGGVRDEKYFLLNPVTSAKGQTSVFINIEGAILSGFFHPVSKQSCSVI